MHHQLHHQPKVAVVLTPAVNLFRIEVIFGVNIDHIATVRNARGGSDPEPFRALEVIKSAGANIVTIHLREDRRHIKDEDVRQICSSNILPVNMEIAINEEMVNIALQNKPSWVCIVPEKREEITTESGLNLKNTNVFNAIKQHSKAFKNAGIKISLFLDPDEEQISLAKHLGVDAIEIHTGKYSKTNSKQSFDEIASSAKIIHQIGIEVHAGHGLNYLNTPQICRIKEIGELNIGHFLIGESIFVGLFEAVSKMKQIIQNSQSNAQQ